jgi:uncharacterized membrane protein YecN with MAPEG domain
MITALYAGLLGLLSTYLAFRTGSTRGRKGIVIGDGGDREMLLEMRRHANFVEYVPLALVLIMLLEMEGVRPLAIHALGATLVVGRVAHAAGLQADTMKSPLRAVGATFTALVIVVASVWAVARFF